MKNAIIIIISIVLTLTLGCDSGITGQNGSSQHSPRVTAELVSVSQPLVSPYKENFLAGYTALQKSFDNDIASYRYQYQVGLIPGSEFSSLSEARSQRFANDKEDLNSTYTNTDDAWGPLEITVRINSQESTSFRLKAVVEYHDGTRKTAYSDPLFSSPGNYNKNTQIPSEKATKKTPILSLSVVGL